MAEKAKTIDHSLVIDSSKGNRSSHGFKTLQGLKPLVSYAPRIQQTPPDAHSEAVGHQCCNKTSSLARLKAKGKAHSNYYHEPLLESSSFGDSNNTNLKRKHDETTCVSDDNDEEPEYAVKEKLARKDTKVKRSRNAGIHSLQERKRRDKINKKMRILKGLIPNCNKMDKVSLLDHAIQYLKTLKLQLQIISMGGGVCMPLMMLSAATHQMINTLHLPQFMGARMGFRPQFPIAPLPGVIDNGVGMFGFPNQVPHMPNSHEPFIPMVGNPQTEPLVATSTAAKSAKNFCPVSKNPYLHVQAEHATKQALNHVSFTASYPFISHRKEGSKEQIEKNSDKC